MQRALNGRLLTLLVLLLAMLISDLVLEKINIVYTPYSGGCLRDSQRKSVLKLSEGDARNVPDSKSILQKVKKPNGICIKHPIKREIYHFTKWFRKKARALYD